MHGAALRRRAGTVYESRSGPAHPSLFGLAPCGVYLDPSLYRLSGALLPHHFTLTPALEFPQRRPYPASRANSGIAFPGWPSSRIKRSGEG